MTLIRKRKRLVTTKEYHELLKEFCDPINWRPDFYKIAKKNGIPPVSMKFRYDNLLANELVNIKINIKFDKKAYEQKNALSKIKCAFKKVSSSCNKKYIYK